MGVVFSPNMRRSLKILQSYRRRYSCKSALNAGFRTNKPYSIYYCPANTVPHSLYRY